MTPDYRALCAELVDALDNLLALVNGECPSLLDGDRGGSGFLDIEIDDALTTARTLLAEPVAEGPTDQELLHLYQVATPCYSVEEYKRELDFARAVLARWGRPAAAPVPEPTDEALANFTAWFCRNYPGPDTLIHRPEWHAPKVFRAASDALARWGRPTPQPVAVSERLPGPVDCTTNPRTGQGQWCWGWVQHDPAPYSGRWRMIRREWLADEATHWLPAIALPTPEATNDLHS